MTQLAPSHRKAQGILWCIFSLGLCDQHHVKCFLLPLGHGGEPPTSQSLKNHNNISPLFNR